MLCGDMGGTSPVQKGEKQNFLLPNLLCLKDTNTSYTPGLTLGHGNQRLLRMGRDVQNWLISQLQMNLVVKTQYKHLTKICMYNFQCGPSFRAKLGPTAANSKLLMALCLLFCKLSMILFYCPAG